MASEEQIRESLDEVLVPGAMRSLVKLNLVRDIAVSDEKASITLASAALNPQVQDWLKAKVAEVTTGLDGIKEAEINFVEATPKRSTTFTM